MKRITLDQRLKHISVIGAAGKMGRGISLVMLKLIINKDLLNSTKSQIILVDNSLESLKGLKSYLNSQMLKYAERNITTLRELYRERSELVDNSDIITCFVKDCQERFFLSTDINECQNSHLIFEAIFEDIHLKNDLYQRLYPLCSSECYFFSNTSSIPIKEINSHSHLDNRIIGFHFYNPPAVQKLVEIITMDNTPIDVIHMANQLINELGKIAVPSQDIAGFIGNGHFIREGLHSFKILAKLELDQHLALYYLNQLYTDLLVRPMGMFQLIDYVGLDVFKMICSTMGSYLKEDFNCPLIDQLLQNNKRGGQFSDGSQKDGFFQYNKGQIQAVYSIAQDKYIPCSELNFDSKYLKSSQYTASWKDLSRNPLKDKKLQHHFECLSKDKSITGRHAIKLLQMSISIGENLVKDGVTHCIDNVDTVLMNGFFHLYGTNSEFLKAIKEVEL